jgi:hypothetical protein
MMVYGEINKSGDELGVSQNQQILVELSTCCSLAHQLSIDIHPLFDTCTYIRTYGHVLFISSYQHVRHPNQGTMSII